MIFIKIMFKIDKPVKLNLKDRTSDYEEDPFSKAIISKW